MTDRQMKDREISTFIWYMLRDYGDISIGDPRWQEVVDKTDEAGRKYPEARKVFTRCLLGMLEDRARGKYQKEI